MSEGHGFGRRYSDILLVSFCFSISESTSLRKRTRKALRSLSLKQNFLMKLRLGALLQMCDPYEKRQQEKKEHIVYPITQLLLYFPWNGIEPLRIQSNPF